MSRADTCRHGRPGGQRDGQTHMTKLRGAFRDYANAQTNGFVTAQKYRKHMLFIIFITGDLSMRG